MVVGEGGDTSFFSSATGTHNGLKAFTRFSGKQKRNLQTRVQKKENYGFPRRALGDVTMIVHVIDINPP